LKFTFISSASIVGSFAMIDVLFAIEREFLLWYPKWQSSSNYLYLWKFITNSLHLQHSNKHFHFVSYIFANEHKVHKDNISPGTMVLVTISLTKKHAYPITQHYLLYVFSANILTMSLIVDKCILDLLGHIIATMTQ